MWISLFISSSNIVEQSQFTRTDLAEFLFNQTILPPAEQRYGTALCRRLFLDVCRADQAFAEAAVAYLLSCIRDYTAPKSYRFNWRGEQIGFELLIDLAATMPQYLEPYLVRLLHTSIVLFDGVPYFDSSSPRCSSSLGNRMLWFLLGNLGIQRQTERKQANELMLWRQRTIPFMKNTLYDGDDDNNNLVDCLQFTTNYVVRKLLDAFELTW
jgi:hypothetical protein